MAYDDPPRTESHENYKDNHKLQGLALWCAVAWVEFAILDMLGRIAGKSIGQLLGGVVREQVPFYVASGRRDTTPDQARKELPTSP